jgi:hypothetical protein
MTWSVDMPVPGPLEKELATGPTRSKIATEALTSKFCSEVLVNAGFLGWYNGCVLRRFSAVSRSVGVFDQMGATRPLLSGVSFQSWLPR